MSMSSTAERDRDAQDVTDKLPAELWLKIFGLVIHIPGSSETSNVGTILSFVRENESFRPLKPRDRRPICLVCKKWDQLMELVDDHVSLHSLKRVISLSQRVDSIQGLAGARVPNLATQRIDITIDTDFIAAIESQDALTHLINILSSCPSLATLSFHAARVGDYHKGAMVGEILEMVLAVCPGLKRLELCIPNDWAPLLFPLSKHHSGTLQVLRISSPFLVFYHPMRLPRLHTLIIQNGLSGPPDLKTWDELSRAHMDLPSLKASAILMTPDTTEFPNDLHTLKLPPMLKHLYGVPISDIEMLGDHSPWQDLESLGMTNEELETVLFTKLNLPLEATNIESITIAFDWSPNIRRGLENEYQTLEDNLYIIQNSKWFPRLQQLRLSFPTNVECGMEGVLPGLCSYTWKERLRKFRTQGVRVEVATSKDMWTSNHWEQATDRRIVEMIDGYNQEALARCPMDELF